MSKGLAFDTSQLTIIVKSTQDFHNYYSTNLDVQVLSKYLGMFSNMLELFWQAL
jgi:hypothetical protein